MFLHPKGCTREIRCRNVKVLKVDQTWRSRTVIFVKEKYSFLAFVANTCHNATVFFTVLPLSITANTSR